MVKIVCVSDLHEHLIDIPECDILLIAGDISFAPYNNLAMKHEFLCTKFKDWLDDIPAKEVVVVAGNHDQSIEQWGFPPEKAKLRCHYLQDSGIELSGIKIWGTPWQPWFYDWAFNAPMDGGEKFLSEKFKLIPEDTDIIVAHGPPYGYGDKTLRGEHVGSHALLDTIQRVGPTLLVCGHIHPAYGEYTYKHDENSATWIVNASIVNENYEVSNKLVVWDYSWA